MNRSFINGNSCKCLALIFFLSVKAGLFAQPISIDRGVRAEGLWCFPLVSDSLSWLYLPDKGVLGLDESKQPQFSFIRYVEITDNPDPESATSITKAAGGAVLHFLVTYDTDEKKVARANDKLKEIFSNGNIKIRGPIIFREGRYALVSSILNPATDNTEKKIMSMGSAPVLQGSKIALSFELDPVHSTLLLESLKMPTPDVSIVFDMNFSGLTDAYKAKVTVDWDLVHKSQEISAGLKIYYVSTELELMFDELRRKGAVKIETEGEDEKMQAIVEGAYAKVMEMLFQKVEPEQLPAAEKDEMSTMLQNTFGGKSGDMFSGGKWFPFGAHAGYKRKNIRNSGSSVLYFNSRVPVDRHYFITFNISDFYKKYGENEDYIRNVSLTDPTFLKRDITVGVDGTLLPEFDKLINNVTVTLRKKHQDGTTTLKEVKILKSTMDNGRAISMSYGSFGDKDRLAWLNYEYNAQFSFLGGRAWETGWRQQNTAMINLLTPYERRVIRIEANPDSLRAKNVRATTVQVQYTFLDGIKTFETTVKPEDDLSKMQFEITLPEGKFIYKYTLRWRFKDGTERTSTGETDMSILFIDSVPVK